MTAMAVHDISVPLRADMPTYAGEPGPSLEFPKRLAKGDSATVSVLTLGSHTGTHVDAPCHFLDGAPSVESLPLEALVGPAFVAEHGGDDHITAADLDSMGALAPDAGRALAERGMKLVGIDYLSIERFRASPHEVHETLLASGVVILEGLDLRRVAAGSYYLVCAPLNVVGAEGAPARAFLVDGAP
jgi:arylformamidase